MNDNKIIIILADFFSQWLGVVMVIIRFLTTTTYERDDTPEKKILFNKKNYKIEYQVTNIRCNNIQYINFSLISRCHIILNRDHKIKTIQFKLSLFIYFASYLLHPFNFYRKLDFQAQP